MTEFLKVANKPLAIETTYNFRSLENYPTYENKRTKAHYYRSDSLSNVSKEGWKTVSDLNIDLIIDLRSKTEIESSKSIYPCPIQIVQTSLLDNMASSGFKNSSLSNLSSIYIGMLEQQQDKLADIFKLLSVQKHPTLFHCTAGKDRTGVVSMLLLDLVQVKEEHILADYTVSQYYMKKPFAKIRQQYPSAMNMFFTSPVDDMIRTRKWLKSQFGTVGHYLSHLGLSLKDIDNIKKNLME